MINLRYHIVSLAAAFLAFGLGILAGTSVINTGLVNSLRTNTVTLQKNLNEVRANVSQLQKQLGVGDDFGRAISPSLLQGRLAGRAVVLLVDDKVPGALLSQVDEALRLAGAKPPAQITLTDRWVLDGPDTIGQLIQATGTSATARDAVLQDAAGRLGSRLGSSSDPRADGDLIRSLSDAGFLDIRDLPAAGSFPAANALVTVVTSGDAQQVPSDDGFFIPLLKALYPLRIVAVTEPTTAEQSLAELVRSDRAMARAVCTVDHVDTVAGRLSLAYGLRALINGKAATHYGVRAGATAVAPDLRSA